VAKKKKNAPPKHFMMNLRDTRRTPEDFGLVESSVPDIYIKDNDGTKWIKRPMIYDLGREFFKAFCKIPIPDYSGLLAIVLNSDSMEDEYGAASIMLELFPEEVYDTCMDLLEDELVFKTCWDFFDLLDIESAFNRSETQGKPIEKVEQDYAKWAALAYRVSELRRKYKLRNRYRIVWPPT